MLLRGENLIDTDAKICELYSCDQPVLRRHPAKYCSPDCSKEANRWNASQPQRSPTTLLPEVELLDGWTVEVSNGWVSYRDKEGKLQRKDRDSSLFQNKKLYELEPLPEEYEEE